MEHFIQDLRYGCRMLIRQSGFALTAVMALALGIGANTAVFSVVYAALLKPLPFAQPGQLLFIHDTFPSVPSASVSWPKFVALRDGNRTLSGLAAVFGGSLTITGHGDPEQIITANVSGDFFSVLGVSPQVGRPLNRDDDVPGGGKVLALSYGYWQRRFGGDPRIVGQTLTVGGEAFTVASVMPASFNYPAGVDAWVPLALSTAARANQGNNFLRLVGRLKPQTTLEQATADLTAITASYNQTNKLQRDLKIWRLQDFLTARNRQMLVILQVTVGFVLLIACANVANLLLARSVSRGRELSIRAAMGAGRVRLVRQLLTESVLLSTLGGVVGVLLASWLLRLFLALAPPNFSGVAAVKIDMQVLGVTLALAVLTGLLFGLAPARRGFQIDPNDGLRDAGTRGATSAGAKGASRALVVGEISLAVVLVIGAGLLVKSLLRLEAQDTGFRPDGALTFRMNLPQVKYPKNEQVVATYERVLDEIRSAPGVKAAAAINYVPLVNFGFNGSFNIVGRPPFQDQSTAPSIEFRFVTPGYFAAMGIPILRGRDFAETDTASTQQVAIVNAAVANQFWPRENPIGGRLTFGSGTQNQNEIVGVVGDAREASLSTPAAIEAYFPLRQAPARGMGIIVRTERSDPSALLPAIRQRLAALDADLPLVKPQTMTTVVEASAGSSRLSSVLTAVFALLAGLLSSVGIYSLIAYSVAERTRELGIRVALGADRRSVLRLIVGEGLVLAAIGIVIGLAGALMLTGSLRTLLYEVNPIDPAVLSITCVAVLVVAALASYIPARRALRVDPMIALRAE